MKHLYTFTTLLFLFCTVLIGQTEWTGPITTFTKSDGADWTQEANQDRITDNVWITRQNFEGVYNIVSETSYSSFESPNDTEWAYGTIADGVGSLTFDDWESTNGSSPPSMVNQDMVLHLITDDIYIDIKFTSWSCCGNGGFAYERSTDQSLSATEFEANSNLKLFPNPASQSVQISGLTKEENYTIHNVLGLSVNKGSITDNEPIDIRNLSNGLYFLKFENGYALKFIKE